MPPDGPRTRVPRLGLLLLRPDPVHGSPLRGPSDGSVRESNAGEQFARPFIVKLKYQSVKGREPGSAEKKATRLAV